MAIFYGFGRRVRAHRRSPTFDIPADWSLRKVEEIREGDSGGLRHSYAVVSRDEMPYRDSKQQSIGLERGRGFAY